jgi:hypothetical protein
MPPSRLSSIDMDDIGSTQPSRPLVFQPLLDSSLKECERRTREDFDIHRNRPIHELTRCESVEYALEYLQRVALEFRLRIGKVIIVSLSHIRCLNDMYRDQGPSGP